MKILHVIHSVSDSLGGPTEAVINLTKALREHGVDAEIATTNDDSGGTLTVPVNERIIYREVPVRFFPRLSVRFNQYFISWGLTRWLWGHMTEYDLVWVHYLFTYTSLCSALIARTKRVPYIMGTVGQLSPLALAHGAVRKRIYLAVLEKRNLDRAAGIHCASEGEARDVRNFGVRAPVITVPLGTNKVLRSPEAKERFREKYGISSKKLVLLFLGRIHETKRPKLLLEALAKLAPVYPDLHLVLAGSGEKAYMQEVSDLAAALAVSDRVTFTGFVSGPEKDLVLQGADIFVLPSSFESFGMALVEAMSAGVPAIATSNVHLASELGRNGCLLVAEGTCDSLAGEIAKLASSTELRREIGERGMRYAADHYSWDRVAASLMNAFNTISEGRSGSPDNGVNI